MRDKIEADWAEMFNQRFGAAITRRNVAIYTPIVPNITLPLNLYNDGTTQPPKAVRDFQQNQRLSNTEPLEHQRISHKTTSVNPYLAVDTNPNFKGDGKYFPDYHVNHPFYGKLPETSTTGRLVAPMKSREIPVEIRRRLP